MDVRIEFLLVPRPINEQRRKNKNVAVSQPTASVLFTVDLKITWADRQLQQRIHLPKSALVGTASLGSCGLRGAQAALAQAA